MKVLELNQVAEVAGGVCGYDMTIHLDIPASQSVGVAQLFDLIITGQISDFNAFQQALQDAVVINGLDFNAVKITNIGFSLC